MGRIGFVFDRAKAIESILYLVQKVSDADRYGICKLLYLVDKTSLEKYGRFVFGDSYFAMKEGPVPSNAYNLLKEAAKEPVDGLKVEGNQVIAERGPDLDRLSESDIECLDQIIEIYGRVPNWVRRREVHDQAWRQTWKKRRSKKSVEIPIKSIAQMLSDSDELLDYLTNRDLE